MRPSGSQCAPVNPRVAIGVRPMRCRRVGRTFVVVVCSVVQCGLVGSQCREWDGGEVEALSCRAPPLLLGQQRPVNHLLLLLTARRRRRHERLLHNTATVERWNGRTAEHLGETLRLLHDRSWHGGTIVSSNTNMYRKSFVFTNLVIN